MGADSRTIVFFGTPDFAVGILKSMAEAGLQVAAVVTAPDKPAGRGRNIQVPPVKKYAKSLGYKVLQPASLKNQEFLGTLKSLRPALFVVVAFRMLPAEVWKIPALGTFNLHASLLPQYRGAAPINWAVINGEKKTGVTTFFINEEIDKGSVLFSEETEITDTDTAGTLHDRLMSIGAELTVKTINAIFSNTVKPREQKTLSTKGSLRPAPKIFRDDCRINWEKPVHDVYNFIRGLDPSPGAWTLMQLNGVDLVVKIFSCRPVEITHDKPAGTIVKEGDSLMVAASGGYLNILSLQLEGKKKMQTEDFLRGFKDAGSGKFH